MPNATDVEQEASSNKYAALRAMAVGDNPYQAGADATRSASNEALSGMASDAALRGVTPDEQNDLNKIASGPSSIAAQSLEDTSGPFSAYQKALQATGVARVQPSTKITIGGGGDGTTTGDQYKPKMYGPYLQYGGYATQGEFEDAATAFARHAAQDDASQQEGARVEGENAQIDQAAHDFANQWGAATAAQQMPAGTVIHGPAWTGPQPDIAPLQTPSGAPQTAAEVAAREMIAQGVSPAEPRQGWFNASGYAEPADAALSTARQLPQQVATIAQPYDRAIAQITDPRNLYLYAQDAAQSRFGAEPLYSEGHFSPEWALGLATDDLTGPNNYAQAQDEYRQRQANGGLTAAELAGQVTAAHTADVGAVRASDDYRKGAVWIDGKVQAAGAGGKPISLDEVRYGLAQEGVPSDVISQLVSDYGNVFPSQSYVNNQPDVNPLVAPRNPGGG